MEASAAGLAAAPASGDAAADGQGQQQAGAGDGAAQQQAPAIDAVLARVAETLEANHEILSQRPWEQPAAGAEGQQDGKDGAGADGSGELDLSFLDDTQPGWTQEKALKDLADLIDGRAGEKAQQMIAPALQRIGAVESSLAIDDLVARYPEFGKPEVAKKVMADAKTWAESVNSPELGSNPEVYHLIYLANLALEQREREDAAGADGAATLEGAGGASPGGSGQGGAAMTSQQWGEKHAKGSGSLPLFTRRTG